MAGNTTPTESTGNGVSLESLLAQHAAIQRKLKMKQAENNAIKEYQKTLADERIASDRESQAKMNKLNTLQRLQQSKQQELARNLRMRSLLKSSFEGNNYEDENSDEENIPIPDINKLKLMKEQYEAELRERKWLPELNKARMEAEYARNEKVKMRDRHDHELEHYQEAMIKLDRYKCLNYRDFILDAVTAAKKLYEQRKKLAVILVRNAKLSTSSDDSLDEEYKLPLKSDSPHVDTPRPRLQLPLVHNEKTQAKVESRVPKNVVQQPREKTFSSDPEIGAVTKPSSQENQKTPRLVSDYCSQEYKNDEHEDVEIIDEDQENRGSQEEEEEIRETNSGHNDSIQVLEDDEKDRSDSIIIHDDQTEYNDICNDIMDHDGGFDFGGEENNNSIIIEDNDNDPKDDGFKLNDSLESPNTSDNNIELISPKSPVFAVPKIPERRLKQSKKDEPVFQLEDNSFTFNSFDPLKTGNSQHVEEDILDQIINTSQGSGDHAADFLHLASNSAESDSQHDNGGGFDFNLFSSDNGEGDEQPFNFSLGSANKDSSGINFFGF